MRLRRGKEESRAAERELPKNLPEISHAVRLRVQVDRNGSADEVFVELPSKIADMGWGDDDDRVQLLIFPPDVSFLPAGIDLTVEHTLIWTSESGQMELPVRVGAPKQVEYGEVWVIRVTGPARRIQRRMFCRVALQLPIRMHVEGTDEVPEYDGVGTTLDLSEGGALCMLEADPPVAGSAVVISVTLAGEPLKIPAVVIRQVPQEHSPQPALALRFDDPDEYGDLIRHEVFAAQMRARTSRAAGD